VKRPEFGFNSVAGSLVKSSEHGIASQELLTEGRMQKLVPAEVRGPSSTGRVSEDPGGAVLVVSTNSTSASGAMEPFSEMTTRQTLARQGHVDRLVPRTFGFWSKSDANHTTATGQIDRRSIVWFDNIKILPTEIESFRRAQPSEPQEKGGKTGEGHFPASLRGSCRKTLFLEVRDQTSDVTIQEGDQRIDVLANSGGDS
jgi:hypothetical protein